MATNAKQQKTTTTPTNFDMPHVKNGRDPATGDSLTEVGKIPMILPHERVFPIQIGSELFKLSGASISSDAPSYFSQYFCCQVRNAHERGEDLSTAIRTLYIDRDPGTFHDISLHLQGYHIKPRDGTHFVRLFADAQFYSLPKLVSQLFDESIFISIGHREFQIPRDIFTLEPGNTPNFFSLGFAIFFSNPEDLFPGLDRDGLIRPPSILPPCVPNRSADIFAELLHLLRGYPVTIRSEIHRQELLRDCRYFNFKGLEQKLIAHHISHNQARQRDEIVLRLEDILKSGISVVTDATASAAAAAINTGTATTPDSATYDPLAGWVNYARPFVDDRPAELVLEIGNESTRVLHVGGAAPRAEFFRSTRARVARLFEVVATKLNLPPTTQPLGLLMASGGAGSQPPTPGHTPLSEDLVRVVIGRDAHVVLDGRPWTPPDDDAEESDAPSGEGPRKRRRVDDTLGSGDEEWIVRTGQWRLRIRGSKGGKSSVECVLVAVRLDAYSCESARNAARGFLGGA